MTSFDQLPIYQTVAASARPLIDDTQARMEWLDAFVRHLRERSSDLPESQRDQVEWDYLLTARQIEVIQIEGAHIYIFVTTRFEDWQEEIVIHDACPPEKLLDFIEKILGSLKWKRTIPQDNSHMLFVIQPWETYGDSLKYFFLEVLQSLDHYRNWPQDWEKGIDDTTRLPFLNVNGRAFLDGGWGSVVIGNIFELSPETYAEKVVDFAVSSAPRVEGQKTQDAKPVEIKAHGVYLYPPIWVGEPLNPSLSELVNRSYWTKYEETRLSTTYRDRMLLVTAEGFVVIAESDRNRVANFLNEIASMMLIRGTPAHAVRDHEIWTANINPDSRKVMVTGGQLSSLRSSLHKAKHEEYPRHIPILRKPLSVELIRSVIDDAQKFLPHEPLRSMSLFLLEAHTHYDDGEYSQSFIMSWIIHEKEIGKIWRKFLEEKKVTEERLDSLTNSNNWTTNHILGTLGLAGALAQEEHNLLLKFKRKRNRVVHRGEAVSKEEAEEALTSAQAVVSRYTGKTWVVTNS